MNFKRANQWDKNTIRIRAASGDYSPGAVS